MDEEEEGVKGKKRKTGKEEVGDKKGADGDDTNAQGKKATKVCVYVCMLGSYILHKMMICHNGYDS